MALGRFCNKQASLGLLPWVSERELSCEGITYASLPSVRAEGNEGILDLDYVSPISLLTKSNLSAATYRVHAELIENVVWPRRRAPYSELGSFPLFSAQKKSDRISRGEKGPEFRRREDGNGDFLAL
jgi:hypothetical protein